MLDTIVWLWCMWRVRRKYNALIFSKRKKLLMDLRPYLSEYDSAITYPDACFYIKPADVKRAIDNN